MTIGSNAVVKPILVLVFQLACYLVVLAHLTDCEGVIEAAFPVNSKSSLLHAGPGHAELLTTIQALPIRRPRPQLASFEQVFHDDISTGNQTIFYGTAISGRTVVVGLPEDDDKATNFGAVIVFHDLIGDGSSWEFAEKLYASDPAFNASFGYTLGPWEGTLVVGAYGTGTDSGSVMCFKTRGLRWPANG
jgi:FG-GAP repeat